VRRAGLSASAELLVKDIIERGEELKRYMIWQRMTTALYSSEQQRKEKGGDTQEGCQNLLNILMTLLKAAKQSFRLVGAANERLPQPLTVLSELNRWL